MNTYRSPISAIIHSVTGRDLGSNHLGSRFMKGIYVAKPPLPRYTATCEVSKLTDYLRTLVPLESLSFKDLNKKTGDVISFVISPKGYKHYKLSTLAICLSKRLRLYLPLFRDLRRLGQAIIRYELCSKSITK